MPGILYICSTPIGNLGDVTDRLKSTLDTVDVVYAEDTRRTGKLLAALGISVPLRSYFVGNEAERAPELAERLTAGENVALVSDAGTPSVADPGLSAVRAALAVGAGVIPIPGPSAVTAVLAVSDVPTDRFVFEGFLPRKGRDRAVRLTAIAVEQRTVVFFTTAKRIARDLTDLAEGSNPDRRTIVARELTKLHEEVWRGTLAQAVAEWSAREGRGEFTVVLEPAPARPGTSIADAVRMVQERVAGGTSTKDAVRQVAEEEGVRRSELYGAVLEGGSAG